MNDYLKEHLINRERALLAEMSPIQLRLDEVRRILRMCGEPVSETPEQPTRRTTLAGTQTQKLRDALAAAGDMGLRNRDVSALVSNSSSRLSVLKSRGECEYVDGRYILKPELRHVA